MHKPYRDRSFQDIKNSIEILRGNKQKDQEIESDPSKSLILCSSLCKLPSKIEIRSRLEENVLDLGGRMATLQRFKLLATQCAIPAASPSRSPGGVFTSGSPGVRIRRRRRTLGRLLSLTSSSRRQGGGGERAEAQKTKTKAAAANAGEGKALLRHSLRDLLVSSPPSRVAVAAGGETMMVEEEEGGQRRFSRVEGFASLRRGGGGVRYGTRILRYRLLRRTWRPVLVAIPE